jgi:myo-inositol 2-dehydrogenase / D-chiro-inositol 1-dehydrogenase
MTVRVGVIGAGMIGQDHVRRLTTTLPGARITAIADLDAARAQQVADSVPAARALPTGNDVIASDSVDAVVVTSWGPAHEESVLACIAAGKPVFCEKPLAPTPDACLRIVAAEVAHGTRLVQVGFMRRYDSGYRAMKQALTGGRIGAPLLAHCAHRNPSAPGTFTSQMLITDAAVHEMDLFRWLLEEDMLAASVLFPRRSSRSPEGLQDPQILLLETASGVHIDIELFVNCRYGYDIRCELVGETGTLSLAQPADLAVRGEGAYSERVPADWRERFVRAYDTELQEWLNAAGGGEAAGPSSWDGYAAAAICDAALTSLESGHRTPVTMRDRPALFG